MRRESNLIVLRNNIVTLHCEQWSTCKACAMCGGIYFVYVRICTCLMEEGSTHRIIYRCFFRGRGAGEYQTYSSTSFSSTCRCTLGNSRERKTTSGPRGGKSLYSPHPLNAYKSLCLFHVCTDRIACTISSPILTARWAWLEYSSNRPDTQ